MKKMFDLWPKVGYYRRSYSRTIQRAETLQQRLNALDLLIAHATSRRQAENEWPAGCAQRVGEMRGAPQRNTHPQKAEILFFISIL